MKTPFEPSGDDAIEAMAAAWVAEQEEGLSPAQQAEFARWQEADPRHATAVARLRKASDILNLLPRVESDPSLAPRAAAWRKAVPPAKSVRRFPVWGGMLAAAAAVVIAAVVLWPGRTKEVPDESYATTRGGYQRITLADSSVVELNGDSEVRVHFTPERRQVFLVRGEGLFSVAKNPARPFVVAAGAVAVRAVGTVFGVRYQPAGIEVLVTEGKVKVDREAIQDAAGEHGCLVAAGERVMVAPEIAPVAARVERVEPEVVRETLAWQTPHFVFVDTPLASVVEQFNRRNRVQLQLGDAELGQRLVGGNFRADNVEAFVRLLEGNRDVTVERPEPGRIILRRVR